MHTIGPVWDGNEVWLIVAGGATFAAFPQWYATLFSGFYLALFLILVALIVRSVGVRVLGQGRPREAWRTRWEWAIIVGSFLPALLWGVGWANIVHGVPIDAPRRVHGDAVHAAEPLRAARRAGDARRSSSPTGRSSSTLRTDRRDRASARGRSPRGPRRSRPSLVIAFLAWTLAQPGRRRGRARRSAPPVAVVALVAGRGARRRRAPARAFAATCGAIVLLFVALFVDLFPHAMVSSTSPRLRPDPRRGRPRRTTR